MNEVSDALNGITRPPLKPSKTTGQIVRRLVLLLLAGIVVLAAVEYFVETPWSKYVERYTGPRVRTLRKAWNKGNADFVYRGVKPKFAANPSDSAYRDLFTKSFSTLLAKDLSDQKWEEARTLLEDATSLPKIPPDLRASFRRSYIAAMPDRFHRETAAGAKNLEKEWTYVESLAAAEPNDPEVQFETGWAFAALTPPGKPYNTGSLRYFEGFLSAKPDQKEREPIPAVVETALGDSPGSDNAQRARKLIGKYYAEEFLPKLKASLNLTSFSPGQIVESTLVHNQKQNAYRALREMKKNDAADDLKFHLGNVFNAQNFDSDELPELQASIGYVRTAGPLDALKSKANLPNLLPLGILSEAPASPRFKDVRALIFGKLSPWAVAYCHERLFSPSSLLSKNCHDLLASTKSLTRQEKKKWSATQKNLPPAPGTKKSKARKRSY